MRSPSRHEHLSPPFSPLHAHNRHQVDRTLAMRFRTLSGRKGLVDQRWIAGSLHELGIACGTVGPPGRTEWPGRPEAIESRGLSRRCRPGRHSYGE